MIRNESSVESFFDFCKNFIIDNIDEYKGKHEYVCDIGPTLTQYINCDGTFTYSTAKAKEWFYDAGKYSDFEELNFGRRSNPFGNVEAFLVRMVIEGVEAIISRCCSLEAHLNDKIELTEEVIARIKEDVEEQTNEELF